MSKLLLSILYLRYLFLSGFLLLSLALPAGAQGVYGTDTSQPPATRNPGDEFFEPGASSTLPSAGPQPGSSSSDASSGTGDSSTGSTGAAGTSGNANSSANRLQLAPLTPADPAISPAASPTSAPATTTVPPVIQEPEARAQEFLHEVPLKDPLPSVPILLQGQLVKTQDLPIDLATVLKLVTEQSLQLDRDTAAAKRAKLQFYRTASDMLPDIVGTYQYSNFDGVIQIFGNQTIPVQRTQVQPQVLGRVTIYPGGTQVFDSIAAKRRAKEFSVSLRETLQEELSSAAREFYDFVGAQLQITSLLKSIEEAQSAVDYNQARADAGVGTKLEVMQARSQLIRQERSLINAERNLAVAEQALLKRLNLEPETDLIVDRDDVSLRRLIPAEMPVESMLMIARANEPVIEAKALEVRALKAELWSIISAVVPSITLEGYINGVGPSLDQLGRGTSKGFTVQANLLNNLGFAIPLDAMAKRQEIRQQQAELKILERQLEADVINAQLLTTSSRKDLQAAEEDLRVTEESYRLAVGRYRAGLSIFLDVLSSENSLFTSRAELTRAIVAFNRAQVSLLESLGRTNIPNLLNGIDQNDFSKTPNTELED